MLHYLIQYSVISELTIETIFNSSEKSNFSSLEKYTLYLIIVKPYKTAIQLFTTRIPYYSLAIR